MLDSIFNLSKTSITDWLQAFGSIAVFYTLLLQYRSNKNQQKQLRISVIPKFKATFTEDSDFTDDDYLNINYVIKLERNIAYGVVFKTVDSGDSTLCTDIVERSMQDGDHFTVTFELQRELQPAYIHFNLYFEDILGNKYKQFYSFFANEFTTNAPELLLR